MRGQFSRQGSKVALTLKILGSLGNSGCLAKPTGEDGEGCGGVDRPCSVIVAQRLCAPDSDWSPPSAGLLGMGAGLDGFLPLGPSGMVSLMAKFAVTKVSREAGEEEWL